MATRYIGDVSPQKAPESGRVEVPSSGARVYTEITVGKLADLKPLLPARGARVTIDGVPCRVFQAELEPAKGGMARLTVRGRPDKAASSGKLRPESGRPAEETEKFSVEMAQVEKPLLTHPRYRDVAEAVGMWRDEADATLRNAYKYVDDSGAEQTLSQLGQEAAGKIMRGVESYLVWAPVIRRSTAGLRHATVGQGMGKIHTGTPNIDGISVAGSWKWLKTGDSAETYWTEDVKGDDVERCSREELWTAADDWDEDLYG
jgi:hypothetical protein